MDGIGRSCTILVGMPLTDTATRASSFPRRRESRGSGGGPTLLSKTPTKLIQDRIGPSSQLVCMVNQSATPLSRG